jgi:hypothetical protein
MLGLFVLIPEDRSASLRINERNVFRGPNLPPICRSNDHRLYERVDLLATFRICRASSEPGPEVQDSDVLSEQVNVRPVNRQGGATVVRFMYFLVGRHNGFTPPQTGGESSYKDRLSIEQLPERLHIVSVPGSLELTRDRFQIRTVRHSFLTQIGCFGRLSHSEQSAKIFCGRLILFHLPQSSSKRPLHAPESVRDVSLSKVKDTSL